MVHLPHVGQASVHNSSQLFLWSWSQISFWVVFRAPRHFHHWTLWLILYMLAIFFIQRDWVSNWCNIRDCCWFTQTALAWEIWRRNHNTLFLTPDKIIIIVNYSVLGIVLFIGEYQHFIHRQFDTDSIYCVLYRGFSNFMMQVTPNMINLLWGPPPKIQIHLYIYIYIVVV